MTTVLVLVFVTTMVLGVPIAVVMGLSGMAALVWGGTFSPLIVPQRLFSGIDSFPLMAVPFFILAAELMTGGRITDALLAFAKQLIGRARGGLAHANILMAIFFSGISGSALADAAGPGAVGIRMMRQGGYPPAYAAGIVASSSIIAPIIPPSIIMVIYALTDNSVSVGGLFMAGIVPGVLLGLALMATNHVMAVRRGYYFHEQRLSWPEFLRVSWQVFPALLLPFIILGGIHGGLFTPTEASAVAVAYALFVAKFVLRTLKWSQIPEILVRTALMTSAVLLIISMATIFAWMLTVLQIPQTVSAWIGGLGLSPVALMIAVVGFLIVCGLFIDTLPGVIILVPILAPIADAAGIPGLQFAMVVILTMTLGMITPPVGGVLFVVTVVARIEMIALARAILPFLLAELAVVLLLILFPAISLWLPGLVGLTH
ncbi:MAG TPA: TRAP transporter large permease [Azospirillum sp.]